MDVIDWNSRSARLVAFLDSPARNDLAGTVAVVDLKRRKRTLTGRWNGVEGLAWSPDGGEIWFSAARADDKMALYAVALSGREQQPAGRVRRTRQVLISVLTGCLLLSLRAACPSGFFRCSGSSWSAS